MNNIETEAIRVIVLTTLIPPETIQTKLNETYKEITFYYQDGLDPEDTLLKKADILVTYGEDLSEKHIEKAQSLKWIMVVSAGLEKMPLQAIAARDILVTNAKGIHKIPMAEYTLGMILQHEKKIKYIMNNQQNRKWDRELEMGELHSKTILIVGTGAIGGEIARLSKAFGMRTIGVNRSGTKVNYLDQLYKLDQLNEALVLADYVVSVLPSTPETKELFTKTQFQEMKKTSVFINIGRGDLVDDEVLVEALRNEDLAHAILDVFEPEPLKQSHPFWEMENVTITPHLSSRTTEYLPRAFGIFTENLTNYLEGSKELKNIVDPLKGY